MTTFVAEVKHSIHNIDYTPSSDKSAGAVIVQGELVGILPSNLVANEKGAIMILGEAEVPKPTGVGTDYAVGTKVYWDVADANAQNASDSGTNKFLGTVILQPSTADTHMRVFVHPADQASS